MKNMHYSDAAPIDANRSKAFFTIKSSGGLRILHVLCSYWKAYFASNLNHYEKLGHHPEWPSFCHAYLHSRRREGAIATQVCIQNRVRRLGLSSISFLRDLRNAFCCTYPEKRTEAMESFIPEPEQCYYNGEHHYVGLNHRNLFEGRIRNTVIDLESHEGETIHTIPQTGNVIGTPEGPKFFVAAFNPCIQMWNDHCLYDQCTETVRSPQIHLIDVYGKWHDGGLCTYSDDIGTRRIITDTSAESIKNMIKREDDALDLHFDLHGGWEQNTDKQVAIPSLQTFKAFRELSSSIAEDGNFSNIIHPGGRYLGSLLWWNENYSKELGKRIQAMRAGWKNGGKLWTARIRTRTKICTFMSLVLEAGLSGIIAIPLSHCQLARIDSQMCRYLRVILQGKACTTKEIDADEINFHNGLLTVTSNDGKEIPPELWTHKIAKKHQDDARLQAPAHLLRSVREKSFVAARHTQIPKCPCTSERSSIRGHVYRD